jgi:hypothetical protein
MSYIAMRKQFFRNIVSGWVLFVVELAIAFLLTPFIIASLGAAAYGILALMLDEVVGTANSLLSTLDLVALGASLLISAKFLLPKTEFKLLGNICLSLHLLAIGLWVSFVSWISGKIMAAEGIMHLGDQCPLLTLNGVGDRLHVHRKCSSEPLHGFAPGLDLVEIQDGPRGTRIHDMLHQRFGAIHDIRYLRHQERRPEQVAHTPWFGHDLNRIERT